MEVRRGIVYTLCSSPVVAGSGTTVVEDGPLYLSAYDELRRNHAACYSRSLVESGLYCRPDLSFLAYRSSCPLV